MLLLMSTCQETDTTCLRNALVFLSNCALPKAVEKILSAAEQIPSWDEQMQLAVIEVIRKDCLNDSPHRVRKSLMSVWLVI